MVEGIAVSDIKKEVLKTVARDLERRRRIRTPGGKT